MIIVHSVTCTFTGSINLLFTIGIQHHPPPSQSYAIFSIVDKVASAAAWADDVVIILQWCENAPSRTNSILIPQWCASFTDLTLAKGTLSARQRRFDVLRRRCSWHIKATQYTHLVLSKADITHQKAAKRRHASRCEIENGKQALGVSNENKSLIPYWGTEHI